MGQLQQKLPSGRNSITPPTAGLSALKTPALGDQQELRQIRAQWPYPHQRSVELHRTVFRAPVLDSEVSAFISMDRYATKYVPIGCRTANPDENHVSHTAQDLKYADEDAIQTAAPVMAALIDGPCWLVPVPASDGSLNANLALARAVAAIVPGARVKCAVARAHPVESSCERRLRGLLGLTVCEHAIIRTAGPMEALPAFFVDNVITTGITIAACRHALGWGAGLVYADASTADNTRLRS